MGVYIAPDFRSPSRRGNGRIAGYVTVAATKKADEKTSKMRQLFRDRPLASLPVRAARSANVWVATVSRRPTPRPLFRSWMKGVVDHFYQTWTEIRQP
jgi:hypothetical protein